MSCPNHSDPRIGVDMDIPMPVIMARLRSEAKRPYQEDHPPRAQVTCELCKREIESKEA